MIVLEPDDRLHLECEPVTSSEDTTPLVKLLRDAVEWSAGRGRPALGLAAPQVGDHRRVFVLTTYAHAFINPEVVKASTDTAWEEEVCLSLPKTLRVNVERPKWIKLRFQTETGLERTLKMHARDARAALHELDHLDGVLITDHGDPRPPKTYRQIAAGRS